MKERKLLDERVGRLRIKLFRMENSPTLHDYGLPRSAWIRAVALMDHFGPDNALELVDERAERAADRRDFDTARRWRTLITAIHAIQEDERLSGDNVH